MFTSFFNDKITKEGCDAKVKKYIVPAICLALIIYVAVRYDSLVTFATNFFTNKQDVIVLSGNEYTKEDDFLYIQRSKNFTPLSSQDILNIYYSIINNHWETFTFYCPSEYESCTDDITKLSEDAVTLSNINNFVHPYNSFTNIKTSIDSQGEIIVKVSYLYTKDQINYINNEVNRIIDENYRNDVDIKENIKSIHDYIINTTTYDVDYKNNKDKYTFNAYGTLMYHLATCNGYTDLMAIILSKLGITNYKIAYNPTGDTNENGHVWNAVNIDGNWLHLDLTWDDPVGDGKDYLYHKYFLVTTDEMNEADSGSVQVIEHNYDKYIYQEF